MHDVMHDVIHPFHPGMADRIMARSSKGYQEFRFHLGEKN